MTHQNLPSSHSSYTNFDGQRKLKGLKFLQNIISLFYNFLMISVEDQIALEFKADGAIDSFWKIICRGGKKQE